MLTATKRRVLYAAAGLVAAVCAVWVFMPGAHDALALVQCRLGGTAAEQSECAYLHIEQKLRHEGIGPAIDMYIRATALFPQGLDVDCHAGIHRVGDMVYYNVIVHDPDLSKYEFPPQARMCNRGFYHGIFEHLFQDHPDPQFISDTCNAYKNDEDPELDVIGRTCFHAAGHGLFRAQAERLPEREWGKPTAFVAEPVAACRRLPQAADDDRYNCATGVASLFIQASRFNEYGLSDPSPLNAYGVCNQLPDEFHNSCYFVQSLMVSQFEDGYQKVADQCYFASDALFGACVQGTVVGLFVNGVDAESYGKSLMLCADKRVHDRGADAQCYERLATQLQLEYKGDFALDCEAFPEAYRALCRERAE